MKVVREGLAAHPDDPARRLSLASLLVVAGVRDRALEEVDAVLAANPTMVDAWTKKASLLSLDAFGRSLQPGLDRRGAIAAARKAVALDPENELARKLLIALLLVNDEGISFGPGWDRTAALAELKAATATPSGGGQRELYLLAAFISDDLEPIPAWTEGLVGYAITAAKAALAALREGPTAAIRVVEANPDAEARGRAFELMIAYLQLHGDLELAGQMVELGGARFLGQQDRSKDIARLKLGRLPPVTAKEAKRPEDFPAILQQSLLDHGAVGAQALLSKDARASSDLRENIAKTDMGYRKLNVFGRGFFEAVRSPVESGSGVRAASLLQSAREKGELDPTALQEWWLVRGRIAQSIGEEAEAARAYTNALQGTRDPSCIELAKRWQAELGPKARGSGTNWR